MDDWQLIEDYAQRGSEAAFRTLVERHFNLVRASALRQVNDTQLADEVSQAVFILLARKARSLRRGVVLVGWLFRTTRFVATRAVRGEQRRQRREQEALAMQSLTAPDETWKRISPVLDEALAQLPDGDRNAVLLRFCEGHNHEQVGSALGLTEEAARKRVNRALEKLRGFFARRGFVLSAAGLASVLATNAAPASPPGLAAGVVATALANSVAGAGALPAIVQETLAAWRWAKVKLSVACATGVVALVGLGIAMAPHKPAPASVEAMITGSPSTAIEQPGVLPISPTGLIPPAARPAELMLRLRVIAKDNGEAVPFAQLAVNTVVNGEWKKRFDLSTDESGAANVPYPAGVGRLDVGALSWGWAARFVTWFPGRADPIPAEYTLRLDRVTNSMGGRVCDAADRPVANAEIVVSFHSTGDASHRETPRERPGIMGEAVIAKTDLQGHWSSAAIPLSGHGGFEFRVRHPEFRTTSAAYAGAEIELSNPQNETQRLLVAGNLVTRLVAGPTLVGRVLDETGQPVAGAQIVHSPASNEALSAVTDAGGYFSFANLEHTMFDFAVMAQGFAPEYRSVTLSGGVETVEVRLHPGARLRLLLVDEQGVPVSHATVGMEQWGELRQKLMWHAQSGADGRIEWDSAPSKSRLELYAVKEGWCYTRDIKVQADEQEHQITMRRTLEFAMHVTDAVTGQPVGEFKAIPGYGFGEFMWERLAARRGQNGLATVVFEENKLPWRVRVEAEGYLPFESEPLLDFAKPLDVALQPLPVTTTKAK